MSEVKKPRGMEDLAGEEQQKHLYITNCLREQASLFGYEEISTPLLEYTEVFARPLGLHTDLVQKEMFTFESRGKESLTLRPEGTAGIARHFLVENKKHGLPLRFMYQGPMFRYERPQKGRLRQFHTVGVELLGEESFRGEGECLSLASLFLKKAGVEEGRLTLQINSIGDKESRENYLKAFLNYLKPLKKQLSETSQERLNTNPLRILDSKEAEDKKLLKKAPLISDFLNPRSKTFFQHVLTTLQDLGISFQINPLLVRGLDYYSHCVFEFQCSEEGVLGSQNTVLAGGRYDTLVETIAGGGERTPGLGWACGVERLCFLIQNPYKKPRPITLVPLGEEAEREALKLAWQLRQAGFCVFHPRPAGLGKKMKKASQLRSLYAIIFGPEELKNNTLAIKNMDTQEQKTISKETLIPVLKKELPGFKKKA